MVEVSKATLLRYADTLSGEYVSDDDIDSVADGLRALSAQQREPVVRVKELEWFRDSMKCSYPARYKATTHDGLGDYSVSGSESDNEWRWFRNGYYVRGHYLHNPMTLDEAKSAAQADYEQRIRSAIEIIPAGAGESSDAVAQGDCSTVFLGETAQGLTASETHDGGSPGPSPLAVKPGSSDPASGRSQPSPGVSVDELEAFIGSLEPDSMAVARALLASYRIERLGCLPSGRR